jgi:hypothetical protein
MVAMWDNILRHTHEFEEGKPITFRSTWEINYAFYLEWLKQQGEIKNWEYEPRPRYYFYAKDGHPLGNGYLPDFKVTRNDDTFYLVEIKGYRQGTLKLRRMEKHYPDIKIELVDQKEYNALKKKLGRMLNFL